MDDMLSLVRSLLLASFFSFLAPVLLIAGLLGGTILLSHLPGVAPLGHELTHLVLHFLQIFGSGSWAGGMLVIAIACSLVGLLFDAYLVFYHQYHRAVHHHPMQ